MLNTGYIGWNDLMFVAYSTSNLIFGIVIIRGFDGWLVGSMINVDTKVLYLCEIVDGGGVPEFRITPADMPNKPYA